MEDKIYRLKEMLDTMTESVDNAKKVQCQQEKLISVLEKENDKDFADFLEGLKKSTENITKQIETLTERAENLNRLVKKCEDEECSETANLLISAFGIFE